jgi:predicted acetyltransferase
MDGSVSLRPATDADMPAVAELIATVFHHTMTDEWRDLELSITETGRSLVADDAGLVVGHTTAQTRELSVPGGVVPAAHVTGVGVAPTHRRRGLLTGLMRRQLTEISEAGREPAAVLWASETSIYPRYGYGPAASRLQLDVMTREVRIIHDPEGPAGRLRLVDPLSVPVRAELAALHDGLRAGRTGWSSRPEYFWNYLLADHDERRAGATGLRGVFLDRPDGPAGYALWRMKDGWNDHGPDAEVQVREIVATDPAAYAQLWSFLLGIDLARSASYQFAAVDEPLQYLVDEPRRLGRTYSDALWVRLVDLPAALEARRYPVPVDVVLEVTDPLLPANEGRWRLTGGPDKATCVRTTEPADVALSVTDLGAAYLGGTSLGALAAAGRVRQLTGNRPDAAFGWHRLPQALEVF